MPKALGFGFASLLLLTGLPPRISSSFSSGAAGSTKRRTLPMVPFTSVSSRFLMSITCAPSLRTSRLGAMKLASILSRCCWSVMLPPSEAVYSCSLPVIPPMRTPLERSTSSRRGKLSGGTQYVLFMAFVEDGRYGESAYSSVAPRPSS